MKNSVIPGIENQNKEKKENLGRPLSYIVFKLRDEEYGIRIEQVKEVTYTPKISKMPRAPHFIQGVANIRGDIIAIMDLEKRLSLPELPKIIKNQETKSYTVVIDNDDYSMGFTVKDVPETFILFESQLSVAPEIIERSNIEKEFIEGLGKKEDRLIVLLNIAKITQLKEKEKEKILS